MRPDICIVDDAKNECVACFDVKTDLGYKRDSFSDLCKASKSRDRLIQGKQAVFHTAKSNKDRLLISENIFRDAALGIGWADIKNALIKNKMAENVSVNEVKLQNRLMPRDYRKIFNKHAKEVKGVIEHPYRRITISKKLSTSYIIISPLNISGEKLEIHEAELKKENISWYTLLKRTHPNRHGQEIETVNDLNVDDFKRLDRHLRSL